MPSQLVSPMRFWLRFVLACLLAGVAGCFLPVPFTEPASPPLVGQYVSSRGMPAVGARVALASNYKDPTCARATERRTTDSAGRFLFEATTIRRRGILLFPPFERFSNSYWICAGADDSTLRQVYQGSVPLGGAIKPDSLNCREWLWEGVTRATCSGSHDPRAFQEGGIWADSIGTGFFRLIVDGGPRPAYYDERQPGVFLQWVEAASTGREEIVRHIVELPLAPKLLELDDARLWTGSQRPACVSVESSGSPPRWWSWSNARSRVALLLGTPGQMTPVGHCANA